jgi:hypothetical protein
VSLLICNPKFIKAIGGVMGKVTDDLLSGKFDTIIQMAPFLIIAGEMLSDPEARQGLMVMVNSIASTDDMFAWMDYLNLPADGWEGDGEPPEVELSASVVEVDDGFSPLSFVIPTAYAAKKSGPKKFKIDGVKLGKVFKELVEDAGGAIDTKSLLQLIKNVRKALKKTDSEALRKLIFKKEFLLAGTTVARHGLKNLVDFLKDKSSA